MDEIGINSTHACEHPIVLSTVGGIIYKPTSCCCHMFPSLDLNLLARTQTHHARPGVVVEVEAEAPPVRDGLLTERLRKGKGWCSIFFDFVSITHVRGLLVGYHTNGRGRVVIVDAHVAIYE